MKRLTLLRHGHAQAQADGGDFHRALSKQGELEVARSAAAMFAQLTMPTLVVASAARRTRETAQQVLDIWAASSSTLTRPPLETTPRLYHATASTMLEVIEELPDDVDHVLLIGHNPGISELTGRWLRRFPQYGEFGGFSTAGWGSLSFDATAWSAISAPQDAVLG